MVTVEDVEELNGKLLSERAKLREEGLKELSSYLDAVGGVSLCPLLDHQTGLLQPSDRIPSATWPGMLHALCQCIVSEVIASKKRGPKPALPKILRNFIQKAEDTGRSGKTHFLLRKMKKLFQHILDMLQAVPLFGSDYGHILRLLLPNVEYGLRMGKKIYNDLLHFYLEKAKEIAHGHAFEPSIAKEEAFRNMLTLLCLLQNPPGDLSPHVREEIVESFCEIFSLLRIEDRIAKKLVSALNAVLLMDGLNLGADVARLHSSFRPFMVRTWLTTRDRELKDELVLYARAQLKLQYIVMLDEGGVLEELMGLVEKELDQTGIAVAGLHRYGFDGGREEKLGSLSRSGRGFLELAAATLYEVGKRNESGISQLHENKRRRKENVYSMIKDRISAGKTYWQGAFCLLIRNYGSQLPYCTMAECLESIARNLERIICEGTNVRVFDAPVWTIRCLQELSTLAPLATSASSDALAKEQRRWQSIWELLLHWLPLLNNVPVMVEEMFRLLAILTAMHLVPASSVSHDFWEVQPFSELPSGNLLYFTAAFFASAGSQTVTRGDTELRGKLLEWALTSLDSQEIVRTKGGSTAVEMVSPKLLCGALMALGAGFIPLPSSSQTSSQSSSYNAHYLIEELDHWSEIYTQHDRKQEAELDMLDRSLSIFSAPSNSTTHNRQVAMAITRSNPLPRSSGDVLLQRLSELFLVKLNKVNQLKLPQLLHLCGVLSHCIFGVECSIQRRGQQLPDWCPKGRLWVGLVSLLETCHTLLEDWRNQMQQKELTAAIASKTSQTPILQMFTPATLSALSSFLAAPGQITLVESGGIAGKLDTTSSGGGGAPLLSGLLRTISETVTLASEMAAKAKGTRVTADIATEEHDGGHQLLDADLDEVLDPAVGNTSDGKSALSKKGQNSGLYLQCMEVGLQMMTEIGFVLPDMTCGHLMKLFTATNAGKVRWDVMTSFCKLISGSAMTHLADVVHTMEVLKEECQYEEAARSCLLTGINAVLVNLLGQERRSLLTGINAVLVNLLGQERRSLHRVVHRDGIHKKTKKPIIPSQISSRLASLVVEIVDMGLLLWPTRAKFILTASNFILLDPSAGQGLTDKLLVLLHDPEYRVRQLLAKRVTALFEAWDGHHGMLQDVCANLGVKMVMVTEDKVVPATEVEHASRMLPLTETAIMTLGEIAALSEKVEGEVIFMLCAHAASNPSQRPLVRAVLDMIAKRLNYPDCWKYMDYMMGGVLTCWVIARMPLPSLVEIREELRGKLEAKEFLDYCCPWLLSPLFLHEYTDELAWLAEAMSIPLPTLVKQHFATIFAGLLPLHSCGTQAEQRRASAVLQGTMLVAAKLSEDERDNLIQRHMVSIVFSLFRLCSAAEKPVLPYYTKAAVISAVRTVVDGFLEIDQLSQEEGVVDKMQVFRPDRVFMLLLQIHYEIHGACHPRHRCHLLASLAAIITVIDKRAVVTSTCRYLIHILLQSIEVAELQEQCCVLLGVILDKLGSIPASESANILGDQLQAIVSRLVACITAANQQSGLKGSDIGDDPFRQHSDGSTEEEHKLANCTSLVVLLRRLTVEATHLLFPYIKELDPFPNLSYFEPMQALHTKLCAGRSLADDFVQFVQRAPSLPPQLRLSSLRSLVNQLSARKGELYTKAKGDAYHGGSWRCSPEVVEAVWKLVQLCDDRDNLDMRDLAGTFLSAVGIGDPHAVVFHLPKKPEEKSNRLAAGVDIANATVTIDAQLGVSDNLVRQILQQIRGYLIDNNVHIIDLAAKTLKGLLSTEKGHRVLKSMSLQESAYLEVHSKGINLNLVEEILRSSKLESSRVAIAIDNPLLWQTTEESYDVWLCPLAHSLIEYSDDYILRLCQELVLQKAPLAELVFPHVLGNLAARFESSSEFCRKFSEQVEEHLFGERNNSTRSIQLFLGAMNCLRCCYITANMNHSSTAPSRGRDSKGEKSLGNGGETGTGSARKRRSDHGDAEKGGSEPGNQHHWIRSNWQKVYWLQIDYLSTARAAQRCGAYFTTVLYMENWCEETFGRLTLGEPDFSINDALPAHLELLLNVYTKINEPDGVYGVVRSHKVRSQLQLYEHEGNWSKAAESYDLLLRSQESMLGMRVSTTEQHVSGQRDWQLHQGLMKSLQQMGCSLIANLYYTGLAQEGGIAKDSQFRELEYEAAWRAGKWDVNCFGPELTASGSSGGSSSSSSSITSDRNAEYGFHSKLYSCLKSLVEGDPETFYPQLQQARQGIVTSIAHSSRESTQNVNPAIMKLQMLDGLSQAWEMRWRLSNPLNVVSVPNMPQQASRTMLAGPLIPSDAQVASFEATWQENMKQMQLHYGLLEPYVSLRKVLFQVLNRHDYLPRHLLEFATLARKAGRPNLAGDAVHELKLLSCGRSGGRGSTPTTHYSSSAYEAPTNMFQISSAARVEEAKILWAQEQQGMAVNLVKYILQHSELEPADSAAIHCLTGKWLAETRSESFRVILDGYLKKAVGLVVEASNKKNGKPTTCNSERWMQQQCRTYYRLAHYADALYRSYEHRLTSSEWQAALRLRQHKARELEVMMKRLDVQKGNQRDYSMKIFEIRKQLELDNEEAQRMEVDKEQFLGIALESYCSCLLTGNKYNLRVVFRLVSLWFNLFSNQKVVDAMLETVDKVQSHKFIPLVYQIASRLGSSKDAPGPHSFQSALTCLLKKLAIEHPYHTMYQLLALSNGDRVKDNQRGKTSFVVDLEKKHAAEDLLMSLTTHHRQLLTQMKQMVEIYIRLAELETTKEDTNKKIAVPRDVRSIRQLELVPVITAPLPVDPGAEYPPGTFPYFKGMSDRITVMNGINAPKVIECMGSDGHKYRQLAKSGNDDLRQDAVMEQLFGLVNTLLQDNPETQKRRLGVRTYKVIPFTPSAGVLEWVDGTVPLLEYLLGSTRAGGAHGRYGTGDWTFMACREHMSTETDKRRAYQTVCSNFRCAFSLHWNPQMISYTHLSILNEMNYQCPVLHNFFLERFAQAADWFEKRLAYTRSVATSSMVGYIVGLGDRHSMNILLDQASAEVVHIDLGVAFEQGLMLKTPERVPFRLTREIIDGMGVSGVEGIFRRCCEATLSVMRTNKEALLTIIEVFIYDPLYKWALSPLKALERQQEMVQTVDESEGIHDADMQAEGNQDAARALLRVKQKLDGYEEGEMRSLQGQVQQLIQDAQDPERLSHMFPGWGAWL